MTLFAVISAVLALMWLVTASRRFRPGLALSNLPGRGWWRPRPRYPGAPGGRAGYPERVIEGQVRGFATREERHVRAESFQTVWTFRVERFDEAGNRVLFVPVEMRGRSFRGALADGDWVRLAGTAKAGTIVTSEVTNLTIGASVVAEPVPSYRWAYVVGIFFACFPLIIISIIIFIIIIIFFVIGIQG